MDVDRTDSPAETRIDLESLEQQLRSELWEQPGVYSAPDPGPEEDVAPEEQSTGQREGDPEGDATSTPSSVQPLVKDRDPKGVNKCLKVTFEDVIAEPPSVRSFDKVWLWSNALFEVSRLWFYRLISLLLAVPISLVAGILFAILSCLHIWLIMPCVQLALINMHWVKVVWGSVLDILIAPFFSSLGKCCGAINIHVAKD
ncbi:caveolin-2-like [Alosa pseudoharengus]|uniref:caveolin-2-like n=1 Tax=Alosa pseudoharengus TaxID=34774 RepID=UPI003F8BEBC8